MCGLSGGQSFCCFICIYTIAYQQRPLLSHAILLLMRAFKSRSFSGVGSNCQGMLLGGIWHINLRFIRTTDFRNTENCRPCPFSYVINPSCFNLSPRLLQKLVEQFQGCGQLHKHKLQFHDSPQNEQNVGKRLFRAEGKKLNSRRKGSLGWRTVARVQKRFVCCKEIKFVEF